MAEPQWPDSLGWIEVPAGRWAAGRYHLLASFEWSGPDPETTRFLNGTFTYRSYPGHGGMRPGADQIGAAAQFMKAAAVQVGPPNPGPAPEGAVY